MNTEYKNETFDMDDFEYLDRTIEFDDLSSLSTVHELRNAEERFPLYVIADELETDINRISAICNSELAYDECLRKILRLKDDEFDKLLKKAEKEVKDEPWYIEQEERRKEKEKSIEMKKNLIDNLKDKRKTFAGIGTNKAKRRLNKLAKSDPTAKAVRLALEIEDKNIIAKDTYGEYQNKIYKTKHRLIMELKELFEKQGWTYGIQGSDSHYPSHVIYFEIPRGQQISWHFSPESTKEFLEYGKEWDGKENSTFEKLEDFTVRLLEQACLLVA